MKRFLCTFLCALLLAPCVFGATTVYRAEITAPAGERTMMELKQHWEATGYPDCVGYMVRRTGGQREVTGDYNQISPKESWEIGVIGDPAPLEALLRESVSNDCNVRFTAAQNSRNELLALYPLSLIHISLDRFFRQRLRKNGVIDRQRTGAGDIIPDNRRLDAARAIGLYPAVRCNDKAFKPFPEKLHHIVAFKFTVNEHVQPERLLLPDAISDLFPVVDGVF